MEWCWNGAARRIRRSMFLAGGNIASVSLCHLTSVCALSTKERTVCAILRIKLVIRGHYYHVKLSYIFLSSNLKLILRWTKYYLFWPLLSLRWSIVYSESMVTFTNLMLTYDDPTHLPLPQPTSPSSGGRGCSGKMGQPNLVLALLG